MDIDDLLEFVESLAIDHKPEGWPAIQMQEITALADEVKRLRAEKELLEQRIIDLQGHDNLSYIDRKLSDYSKVLYQIKPSDRGDYILESVVPTNFGGDAVNYVFRGRLEDCEKVRDELIKDGE